MQSLENLCPAAPSYVLAAPLEQLHSLTRLIVQVSFKGCINIFVAVVAKMIITFLSNKLDARVQDLLE